jgi:hypothetical protein
MLNYLGGAGPGTMPSAVPGAGAPQMPGAAPAMGMGGGGLAGFPQGGGSPDPASMQWAAVTQSDGSVLLHMKLPDGSLGPVVKVISAPSPKGVRGLM